MTRGITAALAVIAAALLLALWVAPVGAARAVDPFTSEYFEFERVRPWLDPTCYDDDHTLHGHGSGWLAAGQTWSFESPLPVCSSKIVRLHVQYPKRQAAIASIVDYGGHVITARSSTTKNRTDLHACNTDITAGYPSSQLHVDLDPTGEPDEGRFPVTWTVTALEAGEYAVSFSLTEPWWDGESDVGFCIDIG